jgi:cytochrome o ubiquinol oxidase subunit 3
MLAMQRKGKQKQVLAWLAITGLLGAGFLGIELYEFAHLIHEGAARSAAPSCPAFFTLVGTHGLHVTFGIIWLVTLMVQVGKHGLTPRTSAA